MAQTAAATTASGAKAGIMPGLQSTLFWGAASMAAAIIITVLAAMIKDLRPLLWLAWPFLTTATWELVRAAGINKVKAISGISSLLFIFLLSGLYYMLKPRPEANKEGTQYSRPLTFRDIFDSDFPGTAKIYTIQEVDSQGVAYKFPATEYLDIFSNSYFFSFFVADGKYLTRVCYSIATSLKEIARNLGQVEFQVDTPGDTRVASNATMVFSNQVYIYVDGEPSLDELHDVEQMFNHYSMQVHFRTESYYMLHWNEYDRKPLSAESAGGTGVQLPKAEMGTTVTVFNRLGSLPATTTILPDLPFPVQGQLTSPGKM